MSRVKTPAGMSRVAFKDKVLDQASHLPACQSLPSNHRLSEQIGDLLRRKEGERVKGTHAVTMWPYMYDKAEDCYVDTPLQLNRVLKDSELSGSGKANNYGRFYFAHYDADNEMKDFVWIEDTELVLSGALQMICPPAMRALLMSSRPKNLWPENIKAMLDSLMGFRVQPYIDATHTAARATKRRRQEVDEMVSAVVQTAEDMSDELPEV